MKKAVIDYNFHNYQQSFTERMKPIVKSAKLFIREYMEEVGGTIEPEMLLTTLGEVLKITLVGGDIEINIDVSGTWYYDRLDDDRLDDDRLDDGTIIDIAQYLYEN
jgi:hypothetical protein